MDAYNSVANLIISNVGSQLAEHPSYSLVSVGHSLGGALSSLGGVSFASNFPDVPLKVYTFGQPRTGNPAYATLAENLIGPENIFRGVLQWYNDKLGTQISFEICSGTSMYSCGDLR